MVRCLSLLWWAASTASTCSSTWFCMSTGLRPGLYYYQSLGQGRVTWPLHQALTWPCSSPPNGIPSSQSGLPPSPLCKVSQLPHSVKLLFQRGPHTSLLAIPTYHVGQDLSSGLGTLTPEASQCSSGQGNDQPIWRPHFPFCLRTLLRQRLFKLIFFHSKHLAIFFSPLKMWLQKGHTCFPNKCFLPCDLAEPIAHFPF